MLSIYVITDLGYALQQGQMSPFVYVVGTILFYGLYIRMIVIDSFIYLGTNDSYFLKEQTCHLLQFVDRDFSESPFLIKFLLYRVTNLQGHFGNGMMFVIIELHNTHFSKLIVKEVLQLAVQSGKRTGGFLDVRCLGPSMCLVVPIASDVEISLIGWEDFLIKCKVVYIKHPTPHVGIVEIRLSKIFGPFHVDKALFLIPMIVFELIQYSLTHGIRCMFQDTQFRIHHSFDAKSANLLGACYGHLG